MLSNKKYITFFMAPAFLLYTVLVMMPISVSVYYSLFRWDVISPKIFIRLDNYVRLITRDDVFWTSLGNMMFLVVTCLVLQLGVGFILAVWLTGNIKGKNLFKNVFFMPAVISSVAVGMLWTFIYSPDAGLLNGLLNAVGLGEWAHPWLIDRSTAMWAITIVVAWQYMGYTMVLLIAAILNIPGSVFEAARIDGALSWKMLWYITLPLVRPIMKVCIILISINSMKFFDLIYVMTGGGPAHATEVLASHIYNRSFLQFEYGYGNALSVILLILCLVITVVINYVFKTSRIEYS